MGSIEDVQCLALVAVRVKAIIRAAGKQLEMVQPVIEV